MTRAETVAREIAERYPEMMPAWRASLMRQITTALVAFGREAEEAMRERAIEEVALEEEMPGPMPDFLWSMCGTRENAADVMRAGIRAGKDNIKRRIRALPLVPPGAPDAHAMSAGADPEEEAIERAHDEARRHAGEDSPYA